MNQSMRKHAAIGKGPALAVPGTGAIRHARDMQKEEQMRKTTIIALSGKGGVGKTSWPQ